MSISKRTIGGENLIDTKPALDHLFGDPDSVKSVAPRFWSYLSGASHGYPYALIQAMDQESAVISRVMVTGALVVRAKDIHNLVAILILGAIRAWEMAPRYFSRDTAAWWSEVPSAYLRETHMALAAQLTKPII